MARAMSAVTKTQIQTSAWPGLCLLSQRHKIIQTSAWSWLCLLLETQTSAWPGLCLLSQRHRLLHGHGNVCCQKETNANIFIAMAMSAVRQKQTQTSAWPWLFLLSQKHKHRPLHGHGYVCCQTETNMHRQTFGGEGKQTKYYYGQTCT